MFADVITSISSDLFIGLLSTKSMISGLVPRLGFLKGCRIYIYIYCSKNERNALKTHHISMRKTIMLDIYTDMDRVTC